MIARWNKSRIAGLTAGLALGSLATVLMAQVASRHEATGPPGAAARAAAAKRVYELIAPEPDSGAVAHQGVEHTYLWSKRWMEAQRDTDAERGDPPSAVEAHARRMRDFDRTDHRGAEGRHGLQVRRRFDRVLRRRGR